ncbi:MAG: hypothetical protein HOI35_02100 [Woeseia sp.]|jgi:hypothetical protein|nr:hypothetical protein [Woeseia sp.]MBT6208799.1 hypothetical protein [Woeseia sp.]
MPDPDLRPSRRFNGNYMFFLSPLKEKLSTFRKSSRFPNDLAEHFYRKMPRRERNLGPNDASEKSMGEKQCH